jgi:hypothetical protein
MAMKRRATKRTPDASERLTPAQANRIGRGKVRVMVDPDAPSNWWIYDVVTLYRGESLAPMTRAEFTEYVRRWEPTPFRLRLSE